MRLHHALTLGQELSAAWRIRTAWTDRETASAAVNKAHKRAWLLDQARGKGQPGQVGAAAGAGLVPDPAAGRVN